VPEVNIREECPADATAIRALHTRAFGGPQEAWLVDALREAGAVVVSQVALILDDIVGLVFGLVVGLGGLVFTLIVRGGGEVLKHYILRAHLVREGAAPWRYVDFLLFASHLLLLMQDNDVIRFRHLLLRDHFAVLTPEGIDKLAERAAR
jgi:hypothetical protein